MRAVTLRRGRYRGDRRGGVAAVDGIGRGRWTRGGVDTPARWSRGPAGPESIICSGGALPIAVAVRRRVVADGRAGVPSKAETDLIEPVVAVESVSCVELLNRGVGCAMVVAAARASAGPVPPSMCMEKTEATTVSAAGEFEPRLVQPSAVTMEAQTRATNLPGGVEMPPIFIRGLCGQKS